MRESGVHHHIRAWRKLRRMSLDDLADAVPMDKGNLSKLERGLLPYKQDTLERIAEVLEVDAAVLLSRNPDQPTPIWDILDKAPPTVKRQIEEAAAAIYRASDQS